MKYHLLRLHGEYRQGTKYRKRHHHAKKIKSEQQQNKEAWKLHKNMDRDKRRPTWSRSHGGEWKVVSTRSGNNSHKNWIKRLLKDGNYDLFHDRELKGFVNDWDWW